MEDRVGPGLCVACLLTAALSVPDEEDSGFSPESLLQRDEFAGYELLNEIARGGMGVVFRARQRRPERLVALKVIAAGELASPRMVERFHAETEAAARLDHPNIASIYEAGQQDGWHFFSMKLIDGPTLARRLNGKPMPPREAAQLFVKVARAVHHAHQRGVLHRDIKPNNILLDADGEPYLTDFGLAKIMEQDQSLTHTNAVLGTPAYMPPEQALGNTKDVTVAADVYSLGAVFYEMLTGQPPFSAASTPALLRKIVDDEVRPPMQLLRRSGDSTTTGSFARELDIICLKALEKSPSHRYGTAAALAGDVERWLRGEPITAQPATRGQRVRKWVRRHPARAGLIGLAAASLLVITAGSLAFNVRLDHARDRAERSAAEARQLLVSRHLHESAQLMAQGDAWNAALSLTGALPHAAAEAPERAHILERLRVTFQISPRLVRLRQVPSVPVGFEFSADGTRLGMALRDGTLLDWDLPKNETFPRTERLTAAGGEAVSPDGRWKLRHDLKDAAVTLLDQQTGGTTVIPVPGVVYAMRFHPDSASFVLGGFESQATVYDSASGRPLGPRIVHESGVNQALFSPDGLLLVTAGYDYQLRLHLTHRQRPAAPVIRHASLIEEVAFSPDGRFLAVGNTEGLVQVWDLHTPARQLLPNGAPLRHAVPSPAENTVLLTADDGTLRTHDVTTGAETGAPLPLPASSGQRHFDASGRWLAVACHRFGARVFDLTTRRMVCEIKDAGAATTDIREVAFSPDAKLLATSTPQGTIQRWQVADGRVAGPEMVRSESTSLLRWSPDGHWIAAGGGRSVQVWDAATGRLLGVPVQLKEGEQVEGCVWSPDGKHLLVVSSNLIVEPVAARLYALPSLQPVGAPLRHGDGLRTACFSPDGKLIATGGEDNVARLWHAADGTPAGPALRHGGMVRGLAFRRDGRVLATGSVDGLLRLWDTARSELMAPPLQFGSEITAIQFSAAGDHVFFNAGSSQSWVLPLAPTAVPVAALEILAELHSGRTLAAGPGAADIPPAEMERRFAALTQLAPALTAWPDDMDRWHEDRALLAERRSNWPAAVFHLQRLAALHPDDTGIRQRLTEAQQRVPATAK